MDEQPTTDANHPHYDQKAMELVFEMANEVQQFVNHATRVHPDAGVVANPGIRPGTQFGDYTSCIQQGQHQSQCFQSNGAWNAPNMGSIETEPQIQIWGNCEPDSVTTFQMSCDPEEPPESFKCSKTGAGWFPN